ncbi:MAG TPA: response regulator, partial [Allocoleopsis sp.]
IWGNIPVIFLTANTDSNIMKEVFRIGADDFINKPIKGEELVTRIINRLNRTKSLQGLVKSKDYGLFDTPEVNIK